MKETYQYIGAVKDLIQQLIDARTRLETERSQEALAAAETLLLQAQDAAGALVFSQEMNAKIAEIKAMPDDVLDEWQKDTAWCGKEGSVNAWRQYVQ